MRRSMWMAGALGALLVGGCADRGVKKDQAELGRLPIEQKQPVFTAQNNVQVATTNQQAAQRALDEAKTFADVADQQFDAAKARVSAAEKGVKLGQRSGAANVVQESQATLRLAQREMDAMEAKKSYADRLVQLRQAQLEMAKHNVERAQLELRLARAMTLQRAGVTPSEDVDSLINERNDILAKIGAERGRLNALEQQTGQLRTAWQTRRQSYNVAARSFTPPPAAAPPPPRAVPMEPLPEANQPIAPESGGQQQQ